MKLRLGFEEGSVQAVPVSLTLMAVVYTAVYFCFARRMRDWQERQFMRTRLVGNSIIMEQLLYAEQKKQRMTTETVELINRKCHDLKHQIEGLKRMGAGAERDAYLGKIEQAVMIYESALKTGNETLDVILMDKQLYCEQHHIKLTCVVDGSDLDFLDTMDLYALFGNALDNAIESVRREPEENRIISFRIGSRGRFLGIHFENYVDEPVKLAAGPAGAFPPLRMTSTPKKRHPRQNKQSGKGIWSVRWPMCSRA